VVRGEGYYVVCQKKGSFRSVIVKEVAGIREEEGAWDYRRKGRSGSISSKKETSAIWKRVEGQLIGGGALYYVERGKRMKIRNDEKGEWGSPLDCKKDRGRGVKGDFSMPRNRRHELPGGGAYCDKEESVVGKHSKKGKKNFPELYRDLACRREKKNGKEAA